MASLSSARTLGGIGGILVFFPFVSLVGWILILIAIKEISDSVQDRSIFDDALIAAITAIIGAVTFGVIVTTGALGTLFSFGFVSPGAAGIFAAFGILATFWVFAIISAIFLKRAYDKIARQLNISSFATAGMLYLIGAATAIVLIGFVIILIALIFQVIVYFSIQDQQTYPSVFPPYPQTPVPQPQATQQPPSPPLQQPPSRPQPQAEFKFCHRCGTRLPRIAEYCTNCGTRQ